MEIKYILRYLRGESLIQNEEDRKKEGLINLLIDRYLKRGKYL